MIMLSTIETSAISLSLSACSQKPRISRQTKKRRQGTPTNQKQRRSHRHRRQQRCISESDEWSDTDNDEHQNSCWKAPLGNDWWSRVYGMSATMPNVSDSANRLPPNKSCLSSSTGSHIALQQNNANNGHSSFSPKMLKNSYENFETPKSSHFIDKTTSKYSCSHSRTVKFGPSRAVEYHSEEASIYLNELYDAAARYPHSEPVLSVEEQDMILRTKINSAILAEWDDDFAVFEDSDDEQDLWGTPKGFKRGRRESILFLPSPGGKGLIDAADIVSDHVDQDNEDDNDDISIDLQALSALSVLSSPFESPMTYQVDVPVTEIEPENCLGEHSPVSCVIENHLLASNVWEEFQQHSGTTTFCENDLPVLLEALSSCLLDKQDQEHNASDWMNSLALCPYLSHLLPNIVGTIAGHSSLIQSTLGEEDDDDMWNNLILQFGLYESLKSSAEFSLATIELQLLTSMHLDIELLLQDEINIASEEMRRLSNRLPTLSSYRQTTIDKSASENKILDNNLRHAYCQNYLYKSELYKVELLESFRSFLQHRSLSCLPFFKILHDDDLHVQLEYQTGDYGNIYISQRGLLDTIDVQFDTNWLTNRHNVQMDFVRSILNAKISSFSCHEELSECAQDLSTYWSRVLLVLDSIHQIQKHRVVKCICKDQESIVAIDLAEKGMLYFVYELNSSMCLRWCLPSVVKLAFGTKNKSIIVPQTCCSSQACSLLLQNACTWAMAKTTI